jgi:GGDEF domain-containing protein
MDHALYGTSSAPPADTAFDRQAIGRSAAAVWAAIAFFGALATLKPLRFPETDVSSMRLVVLSATVIAAVTFVLPWSRIPRTFLNVLLVLMAAYITALAHASGAAQNDFMMFVTFGIALAACFLPVRTSTAQVVVIALLLAAGLFLLDKEDAGIEALRTTLLLALLVVLCGLVLILRAVIAERDQLAKPVYQPGLLDPHSFDKGIDRELSRASRHGRPLSVVLLEVSGRLQREADKGDRDRIVTGIGRSILGRIRAEDSVAHLGELQFAILAPETPAEGAATVGEITADVVHKRLVTLGYDGGSFDIAVGWADYPHRAHSRGELLGGARAYLEADAVQNELRTSPADRETARAPRPAHAGPNSST